MGFAIDLAVWAFTLSALLPFLLNVGRGRPVGLRDVFVPEVPYKRMLGGLAVVGIPIGLGFALWVIPGLFLAAVALCFLPLLADRNDSTFDLVTTAKRLAHSQAVPIAGFALAAVVLIAAGLFACGVGAVLVSMPLVALGATHMYLRLIGEQPVTVER